jgi:hypothetical protein
MSNIGILCPPVPSHIHLDSILGRALQRGHSVTCFQLLELQSKIEDQGLRFLSLATMGASTGELTATLSQLGDKTGLAALQFTLHCASRLVHLVCESAPADQNEPGRIVAPVIRMRPRSWSQETSEKMGPHTGISRVPWVAGNGCSPEIIF